MEELWLEEAERWQNSSQDWIQDATIDQCAQA